MREVWQNITGGGGGDVKRPIIEERVKVISRIRIPTNAIRTRNKHSNFVYSASRPPVSKHFETETENENRLKIKAGKLGLSFD